jgi:hypothetical protein
VMVIADTCTAWRPRWRDTINGMATTTIDTAKLQALLSIAESLSREGCQAEAAKPCPERFADDAEWCLPCLAKKTLA